MVSRKNTVKVFVVTGSASTRRKLLGFFRDNPMVELAGIAADTAGISPATVVQEPDLFLLDLDCQKQSELDAFDYLARRLPQSKAILLSKPDARKSIEGTLRDALPIHANRIYASIDPDDQEQLRAAIRESLDEQSDEKRRLQRAHSWGSAEYLYGYVNTVSHEQDEKIHGVVRQITERRQKLAGRRRTEIQRMEAANRFQSLVEQLPGMPYIARPDRHASNIYVSPKIEELLGFTPEQWCGDPELRIRQLHSEDRAPVLQAIVNAIDCNDGYSVDYRIFGCDGSLHWFHDEARVMLDDAGSPLFLQGAALDITERKQAQLELERSHAELQELVGALDTLRIEEQKRLAHEMHDDFGQLLTAMKMDLSTLRQYLPQGDSQVVKQLSSINQLVEAMAMSVRRIIADLPPKILEDFGLYTAVESMVRNFECRHRISCRLHTSHIEPELDSRTATAVYRIVQEALNNVAKHAHARCAKVRIDYDDSGMTVCISDDGIGVTMDKLHKRGSFGLIGMRERVTALGGTMKIESAVGSGTTIQITIPLTVAAMPKHEY